ncbi:GroES-like protein [Teratosphaeria destructans]|uniref:GroES-like protein n=1 Tax=Teratosphaeria destructans TaxID=418781 RepID=A0A9W7W167_9PEZI|nr:GroES-like protein [Teratosphaeria destructans]
MSTVGQTQVEDKWFANVLQRMRSSRKKRRSTLKSNKAPPPTIIGIPAKSLVSIESDEILSTPQSELNSPSIPSTQQALTVAAKRKYALINDFPTPWIQHPREVMVRNHAVALNPIDWKSVDYNFCLPAFPWVTGRESAGVVVAIGTYYKDVRAGCFQEYVVLPEHTVTAIPSNMSFESASCLGVGALTAAMTLWKWMDVPMTPSRRAQQRPPILIWGGGAVTGQFATQLAAKAGLPVIVVGSQRTKALLRGLGASHVVTRDGKTDAEIVAEVRAIAEDRITRAIDLVGASTVPFALQCLSATDPAILAPLAMMASDQAIPDNVTVPNIEMKRFVLDEGSRVYSQELNALVARDELRLPAVEVIEGGLGQVERGLERLKSGKTDGKKLVVSLAR